MVLTFRTATLSEGEEVGRVIRAAFTPYFRALGREWPAEGSAGYAEGWERFVAMAVANIRLYQRHGFAIVSRGPPDHGLDPHTRVHMVKSFQVMSS